MNPGKTIIDKIIDLSNKTFEDYGVYIDITNLKWTEKVLIYNSLANMLFPKDSKYVDGYIEYCSNNTNKIEEISEVNFICVSKRKLHTGTVVFNRWAKTQNKEITCLDIDDLKSIIDYDNEKISLAMFLFKFGKLSDKVNNFKEK